MRNDSCKGKLPGKNDRSVGRVHTFGDWWMKATGVCSRNSAISDLNNMPQIPVFFFFVLQHFQSCSFPSTWHWGVGFLSLNRGNRDLMLSNRPKHRHVYCVALVIPNNWWSVLIVAIQMWITSNGSRLLQSTAIQLKKLLRSGWRLFFHPLFMYSNRSGAQQKFPSLAHAVHMICFIDFCAWCVVFVGLFLNFWVVLWCFLFAGLAWPPLLSLFMLASPCWVRLPDLWQHRLGEKTCVQLFGVYVGVINYFLFSLSSTCIISNFPLVFCLLAACFCFSIGTVDHLSLCATRPTCA